MQSYTQLYRAIHSYAGLYTTIQGYTQLCCAIHSYTELCTVIQGYTQLYTGIRSCTELYRAIQRNCMPREWTAPKVHRSVITQQGHCANRRLKLWRSSNNPRGEALLSFCAIVNATQLIHRKTLTPALQKSQKISDLLPLGAAPISCLLIQTKLNLFSLERNSC